MLEKKILYPNQPCPSLGSLGSGSLASLLFSVFVDDRSSDIRVVLSFPLESYVDECGVFVVVSVEFFEETEALFECGGTEVARIDANVFIVAFDPVTGFDAGVCVRFPVVVEIDENVSVVFTVDDPVAVTDANVDKETGVGDIVIFR